MRNLFPKNEGDHSMTKRNTNAFKVVRASTERFRKSAIPSMVKLLNENEAMKQKQFKELSTIIPVNYFCNGPHHCNNKNIYINIFKNGFAIQMFVIGSKRTRFIIW